jgi:flagellin
MIINHNLMAMNTHRQLGINQAGASKSMEKLSSGLRINRAGDDAAGLAISEKMRGQIRGLKQASRNAQDGISLIQTAEGALNETHSILQRMRELAVQASTDTNTLEDRKEIQKEINQLLEEIDRIADNTEFNTKKLINGDLAEVAEAGEAGEAGEATAAIKTADAALAASIDFDSDIADAAVNMLVINGQDIDMTNVKALGDGVDGTDPTGQASIIAALQDDIDAVFDGIAHDGVTFTVGATDDGELTITSSVTGAESEVDLTGSDAGVAALLGLTTLDAVNGEDATEAGAGATGGTTASLKVSNSDISSVTTDAEAAALSNAGVLTQAGADAAITTINTAITQVSAERSKLGAYQNRLEHTISNLGTSAENLQASESRIRDLDMAEEIMAFTKNNILQQAATAMLAQANMAPQSVLQLLG